MKRKYPVSRRLHETSLERALREARSDYGRQRHRVGFENQDHATRALDALGAEGAPQWFVRTYPATPEQDRRGVDLYVVVRLETPPGNHPSTYHVPFDVKTSAQKAEEVVTNRRNLLRVARKQVPIIGLHSNGHRPEQIRTQLFERLERDPAFRRWLDQKRYRLNNRQASA